MSVWPVKNDTLLIFSIIKRITTQLIYTAHLKTTELTKMFHKQKIKEQWHDKTPTYTTALQSPTETPYTNPEKDHILGWRRTVLKCSKKMFYQVNKNQIILVQSLECRLHTPNILRGLSDQQCQMRHEDLTLIKLHTAQSQKQLKDHFNKAVSVLWPAQNPNWKLSRISLASKKGVNWEKQLLSRPFLKKGHSECNFRATI